MPVVSPSQPQVAGARKPKSNRRGLRVAGALLIVAGMVMAGLARLGWLGSTPQPLSRPPAAPPTASGLSGAASLRATVGEVREGLTTVVVEVTAPHGATDMAISDDPTFGGAQWQPVASHAEVSVASAGYVEIFGRFRAKDAQDFLPAITGVTVPSIADRVKVAKDGIRVGMVNPTVVAVTITTPRASGAAKAAVLDGSTWDDPRTLNLTSTDDPDYREGRASTAVTRASRPIDMGPEDSSPRFTLEHRLFVTFPMPLREGMHYRLSPSKMPPADFVFNSRSLVSPAVQVNQLGFAPRDPAKVAFVARAAFDQRSGMALGGPYSSVERPRIEHPDDGRQVVSSGLPLLQNGQGSNDTFDELVKRASGPVLKNAWGGHMDAGDWDRRVQHLWYLRAGLDLVDLFPETFGHLNLDLPESGNTIPDVVDEGLWCLDLYMRLQDRDGGVRGGIEADATPPKGQTSWTTKQRLFAYAADPWSSYLFAGAAAEAAFSLQVSDPKRLRVVNNTPTLWSWYDLPVFAAQNEYTLYQSHAAALFAFGSLAALSAR